MARPLCQVPMMPMTTILNVFPGMENAVRHTTMSATETHVPISICVSLLIIIATMSRPPVEALILNRNACEALSISTKQHRSNHGSPMTLVWPGSRNFEYGYIHSQRSMAGPRKIDATMDLTPNSFPTMKTAAMTRTTFSMSTN